MSSLEDERKYCEKFAVSDLIYKTGAVFAFNKSSSLYLTPPHFLRFITKYGRPTSAREISTTSARDLIVRLNALRDQISPVNTDIAGHFQKEFASGRYPPSFSLDKSLLARAATTISNPGTIGEMMEYTLDRYLRVSSLITKTLEIDIEDSLRTLVLVSRRSIERLRNLSDETQMKLDSTPRNTPHTLLIPPSEFTRTWSEITTLDKNLIPGTAYGFKFDWSTIDFLTTNVEGLRSDNRFLSRWAILKRSESEYQVILSTNLHETLLSALHLEMLARLSDTQKGTYLDDLGEFFEDTTRHLLRQSWPHAQTEGPIDIVSSQCGKIVGDIDAVTTLPDGHSVIVECKATMLRPQSRWGNTQYLGYDLKKGIHKAAAQLKKNFEERRDLRANAICTLIVLDAYIPYLTTFMARDGNLKKVFENIPFPIILNYYDLRYVVKNIMDRDFAEFIEWRKMFMDRVFCSAMDEMDIVRAYFKLRNRQDIVDKMVEKKTIFHMVGADRDYEIATYKDALERLGFPREFLLTTDSTMARYNTF